MNPLIRPWRHLFDFKGRATRTEYGLYHLTAFVLLFALQLLLVGVNTGLTGGHPRQPEQIGQGDLGGVFS